MLDAQAASTADRKHAALSNILSILKRQGYSFVTPTPATHLRILKRRGGELGSDLRDIFGWSMAFCSSLPMADLLAELEQADALECLPDGRLKCRYRVSSLGDDLFLHSAFPTDAPDAVFFGPDSYRFAAFIGHELSRRPLRQGARLVDVGTGAGVGAIAAAKHCAAIRLQMTDINEQALFLARINAQAAGVSGTYSLGENLQPVDGQVDLVIANPPYMVDPADREYRSGGDMGGGQVSVDIAAEALPKLAPGGRLLLYTGSPIVSGRNHLQQALSDLASRQGFQASFSELDPDVFGEELEKPAYANAERIAVLGVVMIAPGA